ncbi:hypothetical protein PFISCL1PPCAC_9019 [Pristionchus fissidentatus]|uniref:F-box domain-containing protein n=1 Tax=Pristionchus fissidentatus TaxID=1538716 RepID=A0AAV5VDG4_9BILA|nr:hypothetical protein PFISCL1PPCAC_9019 [Pristionchus fissidentatus]
MDRNPINYLNNESTKKIAFQTLPSEIISRICENLCGKDRIRLGRTSKRMNANEKEAGRRVFGVVNVLWTASEGSICDGEHLKYDLVSGNLEDLRVHSIDSNIEIKNCFRNAVTFSLKMEIGDSSTPGYFLPNLFRTIKFENLEMKFTGNDESSVNFVKAMFANRDLTHSNVGIQWNQIHRASLIRELLAQIPRLKELSVTQPLRSPIDYESAEMDLPNDDATLLHVAKHTKTAMIWVEGNYTAQGIFDASEAQIACGVDGTDSNGLYLVIPDSIEEQLQVLVDNDSKRHEEIGNAENSRPKKQLFFRTEGSGRRTAYIYLSDTA